jgi:HAD superfamily hydrolase (TIGR01450 family)
MSITGTQNVDLNQIRHVALDMDGTIYTGDTLFPTTLPFLKLLTELGIGYSFLTNNPSKSTADYLTHLKRKGIEATPDQLYTTVHATLEYLRREHSGARKIFALGTPSMCREFEAAGYQMMPDDAAAEPDLVVVGFDMSLTYARLCRAAWWIKQGKPFIATNPDRVCPTDQPIVLVDCGSITAALEKATGIAPHKVLGKPDPTMLEGILRRHGLKPENLAMVGDRLYTDLEMARRAGAVGVLVLTGETTAADVGRHTPQPDLVLPGLAELGARLQQAHAGAVTT